MQFWTINKDHKPIKIEAESRGNGVWWVEKFKSTIPEKFLYQTMEEAAKAHLRVLKQIMMENEIKIEALQRGEVVPETTVFGPIGAQAQFENDKKFKKTKVPYLWIVK